MTRDFLNYVSAGRRFKGKGKGNKAAQAGSAKGKVPFQGKKTKFDSDDEREENGASGKFFVTFMKNYLWERAVMQFFTFCE